MEEYTLSELNLMIKESLEENLEPSYWVIAEIGELRINPKGHCYLELVEKSGDEVLAKMKATIWSYTYRTISGWFEAITGESLKPGLKVLTNVVVQFHEVYGLSFNIRDINPNFTLGERAKQHAEILRKLEMDGIIEMNKELALPLVPQKIALISSPTAAGYQDFMDQLMNNEFGYRFDVDLFPSMMQGEEASQSMIRALLDIHQQADQYDVVAIIRGGGAAMDLDCFDSYDLASHVAQFPLPVVTGIGHERDETITDLVAHSKMKTPTAAAEFLIYGLQDFESRVDFLFEVIGRYAQESILNNTFLLSNLSERIRGLITLKLEQLNFMLGNSKQSLNYNVKLAIQAQQSSLNQFCEKLRNLPFSIVKFESDKLEHLEEKIALLDPVYSLNRGFSITRQAGKVLTSLNELDKKRPVTTELADGQFASKYVEQKPDNNE